MTNNEGGNGISLDYGPRFAVIEAELDRVGRITARNEKDVVAEKAWRMNFDEIVLKLTQALNAGLQVANRVDVRTQIMAGELEMLKGALLDPDNWPVDKEPKKKSKKRRK